jgi:quercetin dioxygenase-like cupin family protein
MKKVLLCGLVMLGGAAAFAQDAAKKSAAPAKPDAIFVNSAELKWMDAPPDFPKGAQIAVLFGNPGGDAPFALRFKMPNGYKIKPHWHTQDEQLTVLSGTFMLYMGDTMKSAPHTLEAGAFHYLPGKMHHAAEAKGETVLEVHGTGPLDIHYLNAADNPNKGPAPAKK